MGLLIDEDTGAAFGVFPQMKPRRKINDRSAAADAPLSALRGWAAGTLGLPSDLINLLVSPSQAERFGEFNYDAPQQLPYGTEYFNKSLPGAGLNATPTGQAFAAAGNLAGGMGAQQAAAMAQRGLLATGKTLGPVAAQAAEAYLSKIGMMPAMVGVDVFPKRMVNTNKALQNGGDIAGATGRDFNAMVEAAQQAKREGKIDNVAQATRLTPQEVKQRQQMIDSVLSTEPIAWKPGSNGLYDRSVMDTISNSGGVPGVAQVDMARYQPTSRVDLSHVEDLFSRQNENRVAAMMQRGLLATDGGFYKSYQPLRAAFHEYGYTDADFQKALAATSFSSARNTVANENASGGLLMQMMREGTPINGETLAVARNAYKYRMGTGLTVMEGHALPFAKYLEEGLPSGFKNSQKISSFLQNKIGNFRPYVLDTHEAAGLSYGTPSAPYFWNAGGMGDTEYGLAEQFAKKVADRVGVSPAIGQEGRWFGLGELTGLKTGGGDFLDNFEKQVAYTAQQRGKSLNREELRKYGVKALAGEPGYDLLPYMKKEAMPDYRPTAP